MTIHTEIKGLAKDLPAAYLSTTFLRALILNSFLDSISRVKGTPIATGKQFLSAVLMNANFVGGLKPTIDTFANAMPEQIGMLLNAALDVEVVVVLRSDPSKKISTVTIKFDDIRINLSARQNRLLVDDAVYVPTTTVIREADADKTLHDEGIDPLEAARVEGHLAYGVIPSALGGSLGQQKEVSLAKVFPAFDFGSHISLYPIGSGEFVAIVPSADYRLNYTPCSCAPEPNLALKAGQAVITSIPADPHVNDEIGSVKIGGPIAENLDPLKDLGPRVEGFGRGGVYLPKTVQETMTTRVMPAILVDARDNGFIGFDARGTVGFSKGVLKLDATTAGLIVTIDLEISVSAVCDLDMGKGLRLPIGHAIIIPAHGSRAYVEIAFYPVVHGPEIALKAVLQKVETGSYVAIVLGIGTALEIIGVTAWIGFLIDVVLSGIVSNNLPSVLRGQIAEFMANAQWRLVNADPILNAINPQNVRHVEAHDVDGDTLLASFGYDS
jgi:hypothetical protein